MVGHEAVRVTEPLESIDDMSEHLEERFPIMVIGEDILPGIST